MIFHDEALRETYLVSTTSPFYIGKVRVFPDLISWAEFTNNPNGLAWAQIFPYKMIVHISKSLSGSIHINDIFRKRMPALAEEMAGFYRKEVIEGNTEQFKKYLF